MGKVQLFEIRLSDSRVVYSPGEPLAGTVTVRLSGSLQYRGEPAALPCPAVPAAPRWARTAGRVSRGRVYRLLQPAGMVLGFPSPALRLPHRRCHAAAGRG
ncbi:hypothetical protein HGM15179_022319 [Zosterops borbonicus]|uniref:Arrestin-like N-terminal domain-containing protein n=1 Tax=Zosterops borbonicus TaxID=364589 RepID=A0A8K1D3F1_9PASS|nr:hypothetical protein HGM15179_022319 [Zosterops borbonicus]